MIPATGRSRIVIAISALALIGAGALLLWRTQAKTFALPTDADQNVLIITIDTLRADALGAYGGTAETPNLDRLAGHGARFDFAHAHAVLTLPSHSSILTGRYPFQHGVRDNSGYRLPAGTPTIATRLKSMGYATAAFVGGFPLTKRFGLTEGFDLYDDQISEVKGPVDFSLPERRADVVVDRAITWINSQPGKFMTWVHVFDPHAPYSAPAPYGDKYKAKPYDGEVAWTDFNLGHLLDRLSTLPRKTLVIVTADHGESLGEHGEATHGLFAYEATLKVPLIISTIDPRATELPKGVVITSPVRHVDLVPTMVTALGGKATDDLSGTPLQDVIANDAGGERPSYFEAMSGLLSRGWAPLRGVLSARAKFIDLPIAEYYDLASDPSELRNQAPQLTAQVTVARNTLGTFNAQLPSRPFTESAQVSEQLRSLGYAAPAPSAAKTTFTDADDPKRLISVDQALHAAGDLYERGQIKESIAQFEQVITNNPRIADAYRYQAFVYWQAGQTDAAIQTLQRALKAGLTDKPLRVRLGMYLAESGRSNEAIVLLKPLTDDVEALNGLGIAYGNANRLKEARQVFEQVLASDALSGLAWQNIGTIELQENRLPQAEQALRKALEIDPSLSGAYTTIGVLFSRTNRRDLAIESWMRAVEIDRRDLNALYNVTSELASAGRAQEARAYGEQFLAAAPIQGFGREREEIRRLIGR